jgi:hypothetical protein
MFGEGTASTFTHLASNLESFTTALPLPRPRSAATNLPKSDGPNANPPVVMPDDETEEVGTLEWAQVIELQAFSDRKVWIEEKTRVNTALRFSKSS